MRLLAHSDPPRLVGVALAVFLFGLTSCGSDDRTDDIDDMILEPPVARAGCVGCHTDEASLRLTAETEVLPPGEGDPGEG